MYKEDKEKRTIRVIGINVENINRLSRIYKTMKNFFKKNGKSNPSKIVA